MSTEPGSARGSKTSASKPRGSTTLALAAPTAFVGLAAIFLYDVAFTGRAYLLRDLLTFFHPWQTAVAEAIRGGHAPLWNHGTYCGTPLLANLQSGVFYPPNWLYVILPFDLAATFGMLLHLAIAGLGMYLFLRRIGLGPTPAFAGGVMFGFGAWPISYLEFPMKLGSAVWLPLLWLGLWDAMSLGRRRGVAWATVAVALALFGGYPQLAFLGFLSAGLLAAFLAAGVLRNQDLSGMDKAHRLGALPAAGALGGLVAAVQLVPAAQMANLSSKAAPYDAVLAMERSLPVKGLLGLLDPFVFGFPGIDRYWGGEVAEFCFGAIYVGAFGILLAMASAPAFAKFHRRRRIRREDLDRPVEQPVVPRAIPFFLLTGIVLGVLLSLGRHTPIYPLLHEWVPGFARTRWPSTAGYLIVAHLAPLAAIGLAAVVREPRRLRLLSWGAIALGSAMLLVAVLARGPLAEPLRQFLLAGGPDFQGAAWEKAHGQWLSTLLFRSTVPLIAGVLGLLLRDFRSSVPLLWTALILFDLFTVGRELVGPTASGFYDAMPAHTARLQGDLDGQRIYTPRSVDQLGNFLYGSRNPVAFEWAKRAMLCNANVPFGIAQAQGCEPLSSRRHDAFAQIFDDPNTPHEVRERIFDLWDAAILVEMDGIRPLELSEMTDPDAGVRWNPHEPQIGRATLVTGWATRTDSRQVLDQLLGREHDPTTSTLLEIPAGVPPLSTPERAATHAAERVEWHAGPNSLNAAWHVGTGGFLRILESWAPGWEATVNGEPAPVYRADFLFMAVPVPEGSVEVELTYRPRGVMYGLIGSGVGLVALILVFATGRRRP